MGRLRIAAKNFSTEGFTMRNLQLLGLLAGLAATAGAAQAGPPARTSIGIGLNIGGPVAPPYYRPYYAPYYAPYYRPYYYPPPAVIVQPAPVIYQQAPVVVQQQPIMQQQPVVQQQPVYSSPQPIISQTSQQVGPSIDGLVANLRSSDDNVRRDSVAELGRSKSLQAVQPLTATLAGDQSPVVREAAARSLAMIGSPQSLIALQHAAQADPDRDVRHSAMFAVDIIRNNGR